MSQTRGEGCAIVCLVLCVGLFSLTAWMIISVAELSLFPAVGVIVGLLLLIGTIVSFAHQRCPACRKRTLMFLNVIRSSPPSRFYRCMDCDAEFERKGGQHIPREESPYADRDELWQLRTVRKD